jgi:multiple sugar transport system substrate-binding protein
MKKWIAVALVTLMVFLLGMPTYAQTTPVPITFLIDAGLSAFAGSLIDIYNAEQDKVKVEMIVLPYDAVTVHNDMITKLAAGDTSYTVLGLDVVYIAEFASTDWVINFNDYFDEAYLSSFNKQVLEGGFYNNKQIGLPWFVNCAALFYRTDLLDAAGVDVPGTWDNYIAAMDATKGMDNTLWGVALQAKQSEALVCDWLEYIWCNGGDVLDENGNVVVNSPNNIEATAFFKKLIAEGYAHESSLSYAEPDTRTAYMAGQTVFSRDWIGQITTFNKNDASTIKGKVDFTSLPVGPSGTQSFSALGGIDLTVNANCSEVEIEAALDFIQFMMGEKAQNKLAIERGLPGRISSYSDEAVLQAKPVITDMYGVLQTAKARPKVANYAQVSDAIQRNIHSALAGEVSVEDALKTLEGELKALLNK